MLLSRRGPAVGGLRVALARIGMHRCLLAGRAAEGLPARPLPESCRSRTCSKQCNGREREAYGHMPGGARGGIDPGHLLDRANDLTAGRSEPRQRL